MQEEGRKRVTIMANDLRAIPYFLADYRIGWSELSKRTGIRVSTLFSMFQRFRELFIPTVRVVGVKESTNMKAVNAMAAALKESPRESIVSIAKRTGVPPITANRYMHAHFIVTADLDKSMVSEADMKFIMDRHAEIEAGAGTDKLKARVKAEKAEKAEKIRADCLDDERSRAEKIQVDCLDLNNYNLE